ncbi:MAG: prolipoprotein diacylglyceryl transferase family protein [Anaerolineae bacterium]
MSLVASLLERFVAAADLLSLVAAFFLAAWLAERRARDAGLAPASVASASTWLGLGALVGARLVYALPGWPTYLRHPLDLVYIQSGLSLWGGIAGAVAVALWLQWRRGLPLGRLADLFAPCLALGVALYDALSLVRGVSRGIVAPFPLGVVLPGSSQPRIPVDLWEATLMLGLYWLLMWRRGRQRFSGELGLLFLIGFSAIRAATDFLRVTIGGFPTVDQSLAVVTIALAGAVWAWQARKTPLEKAI